ncbi:MAG: HAMP domain-containing protein [Pontiellaceae bacterium]|nr:HAMP domain-containing protein [Pontiellaceae bacterium]MBN2784890.1 HAMP domain-containing protein [Pontiellaceae bacterium]
MKVSFKLKIAILSFAISGALLTALGVALFAFVYSSAVDRMDSEIRALVEAPLRGPPHADFWKDIGQSLKYILGEERAERVALLVLDADDNVLLETTNAPALLVQLPRPAPEAIDDALEFSEGKHGPPPGGYEEMNLYFGEFSGPDFGERLDDRPPWEQDVGKGPDTPRFRPSQIQYHSMASDGVRWRVGILASSSKTIFVAMDMDAFYAEINHFRNTFAAAVLLGLLLCGFTGWFLSGRAMRPVAVIANTAEGITARGLDQRIPAVGKDVELDRLVHVFNGMLDRLEKSYHQAVRFSADAAHELQTPLTILQGELDNAIQSADAGSDEQQCYSMLLDELRNLKAVVQKLLLLAHADEGRLNLNRIPVNLREMIQEAAEDLEIMAPELEVALVLNGPVQVSADKALLNQVIRNLTSNAAKYSSDPGRVVFSLTQQKSFVLLQVSNTAPPIPDADAPLLFKRFHRVDKARSAAGSGLGLSLAREIARAHGGDLVLDEYRNDMVAFTLRLPAFIVD